jgi:hypothetical protein
VTTVGTFARRVVRDLMGTERDRFNVLAAVFNPAAETATWTYPVGTGPTAISPGSWVELDDELMLVVAATATTTTVLRARENTAEGAHPIKTVARIDPRFTRAAVFDAMRDEIRSWARRLFPVATDVGWPVHAGSGTRTFPWTPDDDLQILDVWLTPEAVGARVPAGPVDQLRSVRLGGSVRNGQGANAERTFVITDPVPFDGVLTVTYAQRFRLNPFTATTDLQTGVGVDPDWERILYYGTMAQLMVPLEASRSSLQGIGESRRDEGVPPGTALQTAGQYLRMRDRALSEAVGTLCQRWPIRST